uniref:Uncharacterized protein n=1 Tax=Anopheles quadriannulatus TaxID=34691 RepID=A0A182XL12_ANOQN
MKGIKSASEKRDQLAAAKSPGHKFAFKNLPTLLPLFRHRKTDFLVTAARRGERTPLDHRRRSCRVTTFHCPTPGKRDGRQFSSSLKG